MAYKVLPQFSGNKTYFQVSRPFLENPSFILICPNLGNNLFSGLQTFLGTPGFKTNFWKIITILVKRIFTWEFGYPDIPSNKMGNTRFQTNFRKIITILVKRIFTWEFGYPKFLQQKWDYWFATDLTLNLSFYFPGLSHHLEPQSPLLMTLVDLHQHITLSKTLYNSFEHGLVCLKMNTKYLESHCKVFPNQILEKVCSSFLIGTGEWHDTFESHQSKQLRLSLIVTGVTPLLFGL